MTEVNQLTKLMRMINSRLEKDNRIYEASGELQDSFITMTVDDESIQLRLGGPQVDGINTMIEFIAEENGYAVDYEQQRVYEYVYSTEIEGAYSKASDLTTILKHTYRLPADVECAPADFELVSTEVVGFYYGEPNDSNNKTFIGKTKADMPIK